MAVRLVIRSGSEPTRAATLRPGRTVLGRGPGAQIRLADPALRGLITLETEGGMVQVQHDLPHQIYLNKSPFPPRERRTWFQGQELQPTADTVLVVEMDDGVPLAAPKDKRAQWGAAIGLCIAAVVLFALPAPTESKVASPEQQRRRLEEMKEGLTLLRNDQNVGDLSEMLTTARGLELQGRATAAQRAYRRVREGLDAASRGADPTNPAALEVVASARKFVNERLIELARSAKRPSGH